MEAKQALESGRGRNKSKERAGRSKLPGSGRDQDGFQGMRCGLIYRETVVNLGKP